MRHFPMGKPNAIVIPRLVSGVARSRSWRMCNHCELAARIQFYVGSVWSWFISGGAGSWLASEFTAQNTRLTLIAEAAGG